MNTHKALLLVGPGGSGKTTRAHEEAAKIGPNCFTTDFHELVSRFGLGRILAQNPDVIIVEGVELRDLTSDRNTLKALIDGDEIEIHQKHKNPRMARCPRLIFTMLTPGEVMLADVVDKSLWRRFEIVECKPKSVGH